MMCTVGSHLTLQIDGAGLWPCPSTPVALAHALDLALFFTRLDPALHSVSAPVPHSGPALHSRPLYHCAGLWPCHSITVLHSGPATLSLHCSL